MPYHVQVFVALFSIAAGAIAGSPSEAVSAALADVAGRPELERPLLRYLRLDHFEKPEEKQEWWQRISGHAAGTSRKALILKPVVILAPLKAGEPLQEADGLVVAKADWGRAILIRLNLSHQGYERDVWEKIRLVEPHHHHRDRKVQVVKIEVPVAPAVVPAAPVAPAAVEPPAIEGVQFYRDGERNSLIEIERAEIKAGEDIWVRRRRGGPIEKVTVPGTKILREPFTVGGRTKFRISRDGGRNWYTEEEDAPKAPAKQEKKEAKEEKNASIHGAWPGKDIAALALACNSDAPIALADWYWWQTSIQEDREPGPGYYDLLGIKDEASFDERVGFDGKLFKVRFAEFVKEYRAAVAISGISKQPRRIDVSDKLGGEKWFTFDNVIAKEERNPIDTPNGGFRYAASEQLAHLSNGFLAQGLFNEDGVRQDVAPQNVVGSDKTSTNPGNGNIQAGLCFRCHTNGMQPVTDWFADMYEEKGREGVGGPDYQKILSIKEKYSGRLQQKLKQSTERHAAAVKEATGLTLAAYSKLIGDGWYYVEDSHVDLKRAAREFGCTPVRLQAAIRLYRAQGKLNGAGIIDMFGKEEKKQKPVPYRQFLECITEGYAALAASR